MITKLVRKSKNVMFLLGCSCKHRNKLLILHYH